jgi:hypothetical protein
LGINNLAFKTRLDGDGCCTDWKGLDSFFSAKGVGYDVGLPRVIRDVTIVIVEEFYPSPLTHVEFLLIKYMLETLVVGEDCAVGSI